MYKKKYLIVFIASFFFLLQSSYADWSRYLGDNNNGKSSEVEIARSWSKKGPKVLWEKNLGVGYGGASIAGNEVYVLDRVGNKKDVLRCFSLENGKENWSQSFIAKGYLSYDGSRSTPTIGKKRVYAFGPFGDVYSVDRKSHKVAWRVNLSSLYDFRSIPHRWGFAQSPLLYKNKVILAPCVRRRAGIIALDSKTGKELWNNKEFFGQTYVSPIVYNIAGVEQIIVMVPRKIAGIDPKTGKTLWIYKGYKNPIPIPTITALGKDRFFITGGYRSGSVIVDITQKNGSFSVKQVKRLRQGAQIHPGIFINNHIYVNLNENANLQRKPPNITCIDRNGNIKWKSQNMIDIGRGGMIAVNDLLVVLGGQSGMLYLVEPNAKGFKQLASARVFKKQGSNYIWSPMAFSQGKLLIRDQNKLKCIQLTND